MPVITVINKFFVLYAIKKHGTAANKFLFLILKFTKSSEIKISGTSKADKTAVGIYFNHFMNQSGVFTLESTITGRTLGRYVTILIPRMIMIVCPSIVQ